MRKTFPTFRQESLCDEQIANEIATRGFIIIDHFLSASITKELAKEAKQFAAKGAMHQATTGLTNYSLITEASNKTQLRGDSIYWVDAAKPSASVQAYILASQGVQNALNQHLFLGLFELESHFAIYPAGSRYHKHLDQFQNDQSRKVSCILYLNHEWNEADGGELRMYLENSENADFIDIAPIAGRLVLFLSERFPHEVLPAKRERISLAGWFRTRNHHLPL